MRKAARQFLMLLAFQAVDGVALFHRHSYYFGCGGEPGAVDVPCWFLGMLPVASVLRVSVSGQKEKAKTAKPMTTMAPMIAKYGLVVSLRWPGCFVLVMMRTHWLGEVGVDGADGGFVGVRSTCVDVSVDVLRPLSSAGQK